MLKKNKHRALDTIKQPEEFYYLGRAGCFTEPEPPVYQEQIVPNPNPECTDPHPVAGDNYMYHMYQKWANITQPEADDTVKQTHPYPAPACTGSTTTILFTNKKKAKRLYKKALEIFNNGHHKKAYKLLAKAIQLDPKTKKYFVKGDLENIYN
jgi:tetratricopeptide (TPR) repeat protein